MRYAFLAMVVIYLLTFFGCSPDKQKENHKPAEISQQHTAQEKPAPAAGNSSRQQTEAYTAQQPEKKAAEQQPSAVAGEKREGIAASSEPEKKEKTAQTTAVKDELAEAIVQMENATRELLQLTGALVMENRELKGILTLLTQNAAIQESGADVQEQQPDQGPETITPEEQSAAAEVKAAISKVGDSAQKLSAEVSNKAKAVIGEQSQKAKKATREFTKKAVNATTTALDNAKTVVNETGEAIDKKLTPETEAAE